MGVVIDEVIADVQPEPQAYLYGPGPQKIPDDFELRFQWKVAAGSNSGVYYRPGQYEYQMDPKGRVSLPAAFRRSGEGERFVLMQWEPTNLTLFPEAKWIELQQELLDFRRKNPRGANQLRRVVANALDNARKYAGADSRVRVRAAENDGFGVATFEDAGPGIDPEARALVFEPFFRGRAVRHVVPGTGLGLAVVQAVVRRHGGRVSASPSELGGVALRVEIPLVSCRSVDVQDRGVE